MSDRPTTLSGVLVNVLLAHPDGTCCGAIQAETQRDWAEHVAREFMAAWAEWSAQEWEPADE